MALTPDQQQQMAINRQKARNAQFGRHGATELIATQTGVTMAAPATYNFGTFVTIDRPLLGFVLVNSGRLVIGTAAYDAGVPESFPNLVQNVTVQGNHKLWGNQSPWNISGATLFCLPLLTNTRNANTFLSSTTRQADPGQPFVQTANLITTPATGTIDYWVSYWMPCGPMLGATVTGKKQLISSMLRAEDWQGPLLFNVSMGDKTALGTPNASTTATWTAFGSASGSPQLQLFGVYSQLGQARAPYIPGTNAVCIRNEQPAPALLTGATSQQTLLAQLNANITTGVLVKTGINLTGTSAGVQAFSSLSDVQLDLTALKVGNKYIKNVGSNLAMKAYVQGMFANIIPQGYFWLPFDESGNMFNGFRADLEVTQAANFQIATAVLSGNSNNRQQYVQESILSATGQGGAQGPFLSQKLTAY